MTLLAFLFVLVGSLAMLPRLWRSQPGLYKPTMVLLLAYVFFEYGRPQTMYPALEIVPWGKLTMAALLACVLLSPSRQVISHPLMRRQDALVLGFVGVAAFSVVAGIDPLNSATAFIDLAKLALFYYVVSRVLNTRERLGVFMWMLLIIHVKLALHHIRAFASEASFVGVETAMHRGRSVGNGFLGNAGDFGVALCVVLPFALYVIWSERHRLLKYLGVASLMIVIGGICATGSRGAFVGLVAIGAAAWWKTQRKLMSLGVVATLAVLGLALAPEAYWNRMGTILDDTSTGARETSPAEGTKRTRIELWKAGLAMAIAYPVAGVGIGNFGQALDRTVRSSVSVGADGDTRFLKRQLRRGALAPHNMFIQALTEIGFGGLLLILWTFVTAFRRHRLLRLMARGELPRSGQSMLWLAHALDLSLIGLAVSGSFLTVLYYPHLWVLLGLSVAVSNVVVTEYYGAKEPASEPRRARRPLFEPATVA
jgi:probable O-glycosylation ligase (exosortase A-associated)